MPFLLIHRTQRQSGFSLLEVIVAFAIMAMALGALYQVSLGSTRAALQAETATRMAVLAQSLLAEYPYVAPAGIEASGQSPDGLFWRVHSEVFPISMQPAPRRELHWLSVRIDVDPQGRGRHLQVGTLVPVVGAP